MIKVYDAEIIRKRLNTAEVRKAIFTMLAKHEIRDRKMQEDSVRRTVMLFLDHGMLNEAFRFGEWWRKAENDELTLDMIRF